MANITGQQLGELSWEAVQAYSDMAGELVAPESFIQSHVSHRTYASLEKRVVLELPIRTVIYKWNVQSLLLSGLGLFRVDMAIMCKQKLMPVVGLETLVEFKLWTDRYKVARDVKRIKQIFDASGASGVTDENTNGFVVVCPQYHQGIKAVSDAMADFSKRFSLCYEKLDEIKASNGIAYGVGVAVIDVKSFDPSIHG